MNSDLFDLWETPAPQDIEGMVSFSAPGSEAPGTVDEPALVWRVDLPGDPQAAEEMVSQTEARVEAAALSLETVPQRIEVLLAEARTIGSDVSFSAPGAAVQLPAPEREALLLLSQIEAGPDAAVSFGVPGMPFTGLDEAVSSFQAGMNKLEQMLAHLAWVETQRQGGLQGRTIVGWSGSMRTMWAPNIDIETARLHERSLAAALASRRAMLNTFVITTQGAARLALMLSTPGSALLALPVAWKLANQVMNQVKEFRQVS